MRALLVRLMLLAAFVVFLSANTKAQDVTTICAGTPIPVGWVLVTDEHNPFLCGNPINPQVYNVLVIQRFSTMTRGAQMTVCNPVQSGAPGGVPAGWGVRTTLWDPFSCGHPIAIVQNRAIIECFNCPLPSPTPTPAPGPDFEGWIDEVSCNFIQGWVWNKNTPNVPLRVDILVNGAVFAQPMADQFRQDLKDAGKGDGRHAFKLELPPRLKNGRNNTVTVRVTGTNFFLGANNRVFNCPNPIDNAQFFVTQHYADFLSRQPDPGGLAFWTGQITQCGSDASCTDYMRAQVSKAFFLSIEFQETGYFLTRFYKAAFVRMPTLTEFSTDKNLLSAGLIVGQPGWENLLAANKNAFTNTFVSRSNFTSAYGALLNSEFVDQLMANAQISDSNLRNNLVNGLNTGQISRAGAMRQIVDDAGFVQREFNPAFVMMQYIGYLRRHPSDPPDGPTMPGFFFWLNKLNTQGDQNEMVRAFLLSAEYRNRFGSDQPFPNATPAMMLESMDPPNPIPPCQDNDGDGFCDDTECNPYDPTIYPGAPTYCNQGEDRNCNGIDDYQECYGGWWWWP